MGPNQASIPANHKNSAGQSFDLPSGELGVILTFSEWK
jgi:hypothetical protein